MRILAEFFPEFSQALDEMDALYAEKRGIDVLEDWKEIVAGGIGCDCQK